MRALIFFSAVLFASGCGQCGPRCDCADRGAPPPVRVMLRWAFYDGNPEHAEAAGYLLNNEYMGSGRNGFEYMLDRLRLLPKGSTVEVYNDPLVPNYRAGSGLPYAFPWERYWTRLLGVVKDRDLHFDPSLEDWPPPSPATAPATGDPPARRLADFRFRDGLTIEQLIREVGPPDYEASGVVAVFYRLDQGRMLQVFFDRQAITRATVRPVNGGASEIREVYVRRQAASTQPVP